MRLLHEIVHIHFRILTLLLLLLFAVRFLAVCVSVAVHVFVMAVRVRMLLHIGCAGGLAFLLQLSLVVFLFICGLGTSSPRCRSCAGTTTATHARASSRGTRTGTRPWHGRS